MNQETNQETNQDDIMSLLDSSISDLADAPEFKPFPQGAHRCKFDYTVRQVGEAKIPMFSVTLKIIETLELNNPETDTVPVVGSETEVSYNMANEYGQGELKALAAKFCAHQGLDPAVASLNEAFSAYKGGELVFITKVRVNKKDKTQMYTNIVDVLFDA